MKTGKSLPVGHKEITCHWIFDVKLDLTRNAQPVADGHKVPDTAKENTHSTVPSRDSIRLFFLIAAFNDLPVLSADIKNAHLLVPIKENCCIVAGPERLVELGRLDILHPVSLMSRCLAQARIGHMNQVLWIFAHLKGHGKSETVMDPSHPAVEESRFQKCDWLECHPDAKETVDPPGKPEQAKSNFFVLCSLMSSLKDKLDNLQW